MIDMDEKTLRQKRWTETLHRIYQHPILLDFWLPDVDFNLGAETYFRGMVLLILFLMHFFEMNLTKKYSD